MIQTWPVSSPSSTAGAIIDIWPCAILHLRRKPASNSVRGVPPQECRVRPCRDVGNSVELIDDGCFAFRGHHSHVFRNASGVEALDVMEVGSMLGIDEHVKECANKKSDR